MAGLFGPIPAPYALADWRLRISDLYARVRGMPDPQIAWTLWQDTRSTLFRHHPLSPLAPEARAGFAGLQLFAYDPALRFEVDLAPQTGAPLAYDLGADGAMQARPVALTQGLAEPLGGELTLYWIEGYGGGLFLPFLDATSGAGSYGGGRYLIDAIKGADLGLSAAGRLILDFNFAYTPSCAWNPAYTCPLAPRENRLPAALSVGEACP